MQERLAILPTTFSFHSFFFKKSLSYPYLFIQQRKGKKTESSKGKNQVQLAVSLLGGVGPMAAYHTSVVINNTECFAQKKQLDTKCIRTSDFFDGSGVMSSTDFASHQNKQQFQIIDIGYTNKTPTQMLSALRGHFESGTYDLLRKNCNSFSDCALWFLCKQRLNKQFNSMEKLGTQMMSTMMQNSEYKPNPKADNFDKEKVIESLDTKSVFKKTDGLSLGGTNAQDVNEMRNKRLEMLEKRMNQ
ncbi:hypothetical protein RFI_03547 [Reticulomyxa filosa]|uniref:PPPDE domain-containing protein n=1 Tax=Reticulomyxa filosa TaxID=46433 RepID=X6P4T8_RETFI|nr:hypothetical protein RFI_03547 [Reticulomyxa filosa]|eukprot:ETO33555.1 hypothetical protein RFI_03547 [Reticulomyxa filosa]